MLEGLTQEELDQIKEWIRSYFSIVSTLTNTESAKKQNPKCIAATINYLDLSYDFRYGRYWLVDFRNNHPKFTTSMKILNPNLNIPYTKLYDLIIAYLKGEWTYDVISQSTKKQLEP